MWLLSRLGALPTSLTISVILAATSTVIAGELKIETTRPATCTRKTQEGDILLVNYRGVLQSDGTEFDSSLGPGRDPFEFKLGAHQVIKGWDQGLLDMCLGEGRRLTIPPELAYGNRNMGKIPAGSTLVFDTDLLGIEGVGTVPPPSATPSSTDSSFSIISGGSQTTTFPLTETESANKDKGKDGKGSEKGPKDEDNNGECRLLGPFALLVQGALGILAVSSLVFKRWRESPQRPLKIWFFDASKQVVGSGLLHLANLLMSELSSGNLDITATAQAAAISVTQDGKPESPNPCSFYLLNLAIDTTIGIPILVGLLRLLHIAFSYTPMANPPESLRSGNYGHPPRATWWLKQSFIYFLGLLGMKTCVFFLFQLLPWLGWVGDWALRWTEGKAWVQITFVMLIFPLIMNGLQYYIVDSFIKDSSGDGYEAAPDGDEGEEHEGLIGRNSDDDSSDLSGRQESRAQSKTMEANPTPVPVAYDPDNDGESSSPGKDSIDVGKHKK